MSNTTITPDWQLNSRLPNLMIAKLDHLGLIQVTGEQSRQFMQGQVTSDIEHQTADKYLWGAHCDPKGKMLASFRSFFHGDDLLLLMPKDTIKVDLPQLQKYAVFSKAELTDVSDNWILLGVAGVNATQFITDNIAPITADVTQCNAGLIIKDTDRYLLMLTKDRTQALQDQMSTPFYDATAWQALEITSGYPNIFASLSGQYIPQMCNLQAINGICFTKGCYMGQETVARTKYRGGNKRALYILKGSSQSDIDANTVVEVELEDGNYRKAGNIIEAVKRDGDVLLTAVLANDTPNQAKLRLSNDLTSQLTIQPLPYSLVDA